MRFFDLARIRSTQYTRTAFCAANLQFQFDVYFDVYYLHLGLWLYFHLWLYLHVDL